MHHHHIHHILIVAAVIAVSVAVASHQPHPAPGAAPLKPVAHPIITVGR